MICWSDWHREPLLVCGLIFFGWIYALLVGPWRGRLAPGEPFPRRQAGLFYAALALGYLAVGSPLDQIGGVFLFSAHMLQHLLIAYAVAALVLLGLPGWLADAALDRPGLRAVARRLANPVVAGLLFVAVLSLGHLPRLYEEALQDARMGAAQDAGLFAVALLFWWPVLSLSRAVPRAGYGIQAIYLTCVQVALTALFSYILMADHALYPTYQYAPRVIAGLSALEDQRLAGAFLGVVSSFVLVGALGVNFFRWARQSN
jgi:putative membrane protein